MWLMDVLIEGLNAPNMEISAALGSQGFPPWSDEDV
jgi:hypothetical protein